MRTARRLNNLADRYDRPSGLNAGRVFRETSERWPLGEINTQITAFGSGREESVSTATADGRCRHLCTLHGVL